jgi:hypothetical protein
MGIKMVVLGLAGVFALVAVLFHTLIDVRLFGPPAAIPVIATYTVFLAILLSALAGSCVPDERRGCFKPFLAHPYWLITYLCALYLLTCDAIGLVGAVYSGFRVVTGPQYLRMTAVIVIVVTRNGLRPKKAWLLIAVGVVPLLLQPFALFFPESWEALHVRDFGVLFGMEMVGCAITSLLILASSYHSAAASRVSLCAAVSMFGLHGCKRESTHTQMHPPYPALSCRLRVQ